MNDFFAVRNPPATRTPQFKPGDKVRVVCTAPSFNDKMRESIGNFFTVRSWGSGCIRLAENAWFWDPASLMLCERDGYGPAEYDDHKDFMRKATIATKQPSDAVLLRTRRLNSDGTLDEYFDTYFHCLKHWLDYSSHEGWMMDRDGTHYYIVETLPLLNSGVIAPVAYTMDFRPSDSMKRAVEQAIARDVAAEPSPAPAKQRDLSPAPRYTFNMVNPPERRPMHFKLGDKVLIAIKPETSCMGWNSEMTSHVRKTAIVEARNGSDSHPHYRLKGLHWAWPATALLGSTYEHSCNYISRTRGHAPEEVVLLRTRRLNGDMLEQSDTYLHGLKCWFARGQEWVTKRVKGESRKDYFYVVEQLPVTDMTVIAPEIYGVVGDWKGDPYHAQHERRAHAALHTARQQANDDSVIETELKQAIQNAEQILDSAISLFAGDSSATATFVIHDELASTSEGDRSMGLPRIPKIENTTLIDDVPINRLSDDTLLEQIRSLEAAKESLQKYQGKVPLVVTKKIEDVDAAIARVTELLDERFVAKNPTPPAAPTA
jgi:hypothetical protein